MMSASRAQFSVGELVLHKLFDYRGVIFDVDANFAGTNEWYEAMARSRPPKDQPWYHVLVHDEVHSTYVAERNLVPDISNDAINHPALGQFFHELRDGVYIVQNAVN